MFRGTFIELLILAVLALVITFIVFERLRAWAKARVQNPVGAGTIEYGGGLAGFVLVFWLLSFSYARFVAGEEGTPINIDGQYDLTMYREDGETRRGSATVRQMRGSPMTVVSGTVESRTTPPSVTFSSVIARLNDRKLVLIYENSREETGVALGHIPEDRPSRFILNYYDLRHTGQNVDFEGRLEFVRR